MKNYVLILILSCFTFYTYSQTRAQIFDAKAINNWVARHNLSPKKYQEAIDKYHKKGYRLVLVDGYYNGKGARYAAIWQKGNTSGLIARHGLTNAKYQKEATKNHKAGYKLEHISGYGIKGKA